MEDPLHDMFGESWTPERATTPRTVTWLILVVELVALSFASHRLLQALDNNWPMPVAIPSLLQS